MTIRIANAAGFLGDRPGAPRELVESAEVDYLTLEYLAELTLAILANQRAKDPRAGYARDLLGVMKSLAPALYLQPQLKIVTNGGGLNPRQCAAALGAILAENGSGDLPIGVVLGDDLLDSIEELLKSGCSLANLDTDQPFGELQGEVLAANAYLGAPPIVQALQGGARVVLTGRVADASLTVGPAAYEFGWKWDDLFRLAGASVAGHLIECGAQVTGGYSCGWRNLELANVGYPICEIEKDAQATITKPDGSGGEVSRETVVSQLVYEIGDPRHYKTPDVEVDFTSVEVEDLGNNRVKVRGATGHAAPSDYKMSIAYRAGFMATGQLLVYGGDCVEKANTCAEIIRERTSKAGFPLDAFSVELLGAGASVPGLNQPPHDIRELVLRVSARDQRREAIEHFVTQIAPLVTSGPAGLAGYAERRPRVKPAVALWPTLVPQDLIEKHVQIRTAAEWSDL